MALLKVTNIPAYISEGEFRRVWTQPGLECQSSNIVQTPNAEAIGYLHFASPEAAGRVQQMYNGWQGYGNPDGIRIEFAAQEMTRPKREREDPGVDMPAFKHSRLQAGNMGYGGGGGYQNATHNLAQQPRQDAGYDPMQPGIGNGQPGIGGGYTNQVSQPLGGTGYGLNAGLQQNRASLPVRPTLQPQQQAAQGGNQQYLPAPSSADLNYRGGDESDLPGQMSQRAFMPGPLQGQQPFLQQPQQQGMTNQPADPRLGSMQGFQQGVNPQFQGQLPQQQPDMLGGGLQQTGLGMTHQTSQLMQATHLQAQSQLQPQMVAQPSQFLQQPALQPPAQQAAPFQAQPQTQLYPQQPLQQQAQFQQPLGGAAGFAGIGQPDLLAEALPADAGETLYVDGMPLGVTQREMSHIFRHFDGFKEIRLIEKNDKHGKSLVLGFAEFETVQQANTALQTVQGYVLDESKPGENVLRLSFAKPFKPAGEARNRGGNPPGGRGGGGPARPHSQQRAPKWGEQRGGPSQQDRGEPSSGAGRGQMPRGQRRGRGGPHPRKSGDRPTDRRPVLDRRH